MSDAAERAWRAALRLPCPRCAGVVVEGPVCPVCGGSGDPVGFLLGEAFRLGQRDVLERLRVVEDARREAIVVANGRPRLSAAELRRRLVGP